MTNSRGITGRLDRLESTVASGRYSDDVLFDGIRTRSLTSPQIRAVFEIFGNEIAAQIAVMALSANEQFPDTPPPVPHVGEIRRAVVLMSYAGGAELSAEMAEVAARRRLTNIFWADKGSGGHYSDATRNHWYRDWLHGQLAMHAIGEGEAKQARVALDRFQDGSGPFPWPINWPTADQAQRIERFRQAMHRFDDTDLIPAPYTRTWIIERTSPDITGHAERPDDYPRLGEGISMVDTVPARIGPPSPAP